MANTQDQEHVRLLTLEADAIFGLEPEPPSSPSSSSPLSSSSSSSQQPQPQQPLPSHHILREPSSLHALLAWSSRGVITALSRPLTAQRDADPDSIVARAADAVAGLARFRLHARSGGGGSGHGLAVAAPPACLVHLQDALGLPGHAVAGGPTWIVPASMRVGGGGGGGGSNADAYGILPPGVRIVTSARVEDRALVARLPRPESWREAEWAALVEAAGAATAPWAMAVHEAGGGGGGEVVSVCHTSARNAHAVEAGVWTRADWRGRRLAPRTVAAWAATYPPDTTTTTTTEMTLFYSTSKENTASQAVAQRLGLLPFGYMWKLMVV
ncbi:acetyltransferase (GNAT)domain-containing protein [Cordyceps javanica]|uniref:Acetyltransferase (GNAT)domain-containing protein n=1 Tax=Cordyceps javanica TaxID=43265 RepID=A0A545VRZ1_9HYPO|nr:acetyltransferase (GNAT)domain-containing protein [Cordyceps javanica]TQW04501.1 acetyltransferase (GNAT) domain-containing protein [Cordyceps javanica]